MRINIFLAVKKACLVREHRVYNICFLLNSNFYLLYELNHLDHEIKYDPPTNIRMFES